MFQNLWDKCILNPKGKLWSWYLKAAIGEIFLKILQKIICKEAIIWAEERQVWLADFK